MGHPPEKSVNGNEMRRRKLGVYYFVQGMFSFVPKSIARELDEIADIGASAVCIAATWNDLGLNEANLRALRTATRERGLELWVVPSVLAGITAGAPLVAHAFGYQHLHTWTIGRDGQPVIRSCGPLCSFYHQEVEDHVLETTAALVEACGADGVIWDEPKSTYWQDFSPKALAANPEGDPRFYLADFAAFFSRINLELKKRFPGIRIVHFDEACRGDDVVEASATIVGLDWFGVDGRPWPCDDPTIERSTKVLPHYGERFLRAARAKGLGTFALVEHQRHDAAADDRFERHLMDIASLDIDFMAIYWYRIGTGDPERNMALAKKLAAVFLCQSALNRHPPRD